MTAPSIPFNRPTPSGDELKYLAEAIAKGKLSGDGSFTARCQDLITQLTGGHSALLTHSCTAALEMAAMLVGVEPGDEVIMPSYTFVSTANAVVLRGGIPVFVDIRPDTLNIDETLVEAAVTARTRAVFAVHYAGVPANMDSLKDITDRHGIRLVEDAAQALGSRYKGRPAGSLGALAAFSFHETKNLISGEGGAIVINDPVLVERAEVLREKGTNRRRFLRGETDKYTWVDIGSSFLPSELVAAFLLAQLESAPLISKDRLRAWTTYDDAIRPFRARGLGTPTIPDDCLHNAHLYYIVLPDARTQREFIARMQAAGVQTPFHYVPLHDSPAGKQKARTSGALPVTEDISTRLVRLPLYPQMGHAIDQVISLASFQLEQLL
jgi:dTDP-4-amino-4,6-dideoxygalactose transaminase